MDTDNTTGNTQIHQLDEENVVPLHGWANGASEAQTRTQEAAASTMESRDPLFVIRDILAMENTTVDQLFTRLNYANIPPQIFIETLFKAWFEPGVRIPPVARELIRTHPAFRDPNAPWNVFVHAQKLLQSGRWDQNAKQMATLEWIHYIIGREGDAPSFYASALSQDGSIEGMLTTYANNLILACEWQRNQPIGEIFAEALTESDTLNRLCGILAHTPHHDWIVHKLKTQLATAWEKMETALAGTGKHHTLVKYCREARGRYMWNFGPCIVWGNTVEEIRAQRSAAHDEMSWGLNLQKDGEFWWKPGRPERAVMDTKGNDGLIDLKALKAIRSISLDELTEQDRVDEETALQSLREIYRDRCDPRGIYLHSSAVVTHFLDVVEKAQEERRIREEQERVGGSKDHAESKDQDSNNLNDYGIETVRHLVTFDNAIPVDLLRTLAKCFVQVRYINPVFETFRIQIFDAIVKRLDPQNEQHRYLVNMIHNAVDNDEYRWGSAYDYASLYASIASHWSGVFRTLTTGESVERYGELAMRANFQSMLLVDPNVLFPKGSPMANIIGSERVLDTGIDPTTPGLGKIIQKWGSDVLSAGYEKYTLSIKRRLAQKHTHPDPNLDIKKVLNALAFDAKKEMFFWMCQVQITLWEHDHASFLPGNTIHPISTAGANLVLTYPNLLNEPMARLIKEYWDDLRDIMKKVMANHQSNGELREANETLRRLAYENDLTGLPKEAKLKEDIEAAGQENLNIAFIRMRNFYRRWNVNSEQAMAMTAHVAEELSDLSKELGVTLYHTSYSTFAITQRRDQSNFENTIKSILQILPERLGNSIALEIGGVSDWSESFDYPLLTLARFALGESSKSPNRPHWLDQSDIDHATAYIEASNLLTAALDENPNVRIDVDYQEIESIADLGEEDVLRIEALVRIVADSSTEGEEPRKLYPKEFLEIAENEEKMAQLTKLIIERIRAKLREFPNRKLSVSINLDEQAWRNQEVIGHLEELASDSTIAAHSFTIEMSETYETGASDEAFEADLAQVEQLRWLWFSFASDDYGAWHSNHLQTTILQPTSIKLDRKFVRHLKHPVTRAATETEIRGIVLAAEKRGAKVTAEFIEDEETRNDFVRLGVHFLQWYIHGLPGSLESVIARHEQRRSNSSETS